MDLFSILYTGLYGPYKSLDLNTMMNPGSACLIHLLLNKMATISQATFWNAYSRMYFELNLTEVFPEGAVYNKSALVQIMAWHPTGDKPLLEPMLIHFSYTYAMGKWVKRLPGARISMAAWQSCGQVPIFNIETILSGIGKDFITKERHL